MTKTKFDLKSFQSEVFKNYMQLINEIDKATLISARGYARAGFVTNGGFIKKGIYRFLRPLERYLNELYFRSPNFVARERKAIWIINNAEIRKILCPLFERSISSHFFAEELVIEVIRIVTISLTNKKKREEFSVERNAELFSLIVHKILEKGVENYCCGDLSKTAFDALGFDSAISEYTRDIEADLQDSEAYYGRGLAYYNKGEYDLAIIDCSKAIELSPQDNDAFNNRGLAYRDKGEFDLAIIDFTKAIEINARYAEAYYNRGTVYYDQGEYDLAISDFTEAIKINPKDAEAFVNRGTLYYVQGKYDLAITDYNKAIEHNPQSAEAYYGRGLAYDDRGELDLAIADYTIAIEINPEYADAYSARAYAYCQAGKKDLAQADEIKVLELGGTLVETCQ